MVLQKYEPDVILEYLVSIILGLFLQFINIDSLMLGLGPKRSIIAIVIF